MKKSILISIIVLFLCGLTYFEYVKYHDGKLHVTFCNVGQGDAIFIRTATGKNMLIDGGPDDSVLSCLSSHMPFWDRTIDVVLLSHPHEDHFVGLISVFKLYSVKHFVTEDLANTTASYKIFQQALQSKSLTPVHLLVNDRISLDSNTTISILAPTASFLHDTSPFGFIGSGEQFASLIPLLTYRHNTFLFTGDTQAPELLQALSQFETDSFDVMQIPHHGSKTGFTREVADVIHPKYAVISVGQHNIYNLPNPGTITLLETHQIPFSQTGIAGDIDFISDGKRISIQKQLQ